MAADPERHLVAERVRLSAAGGRAPGQRSRGARNLLTFQAGGRWVPTSTKPTDHGTRKDFLMLAPILLLAAALAGPPSRPDQAAPQGRGQSPTYGAIAREIVGDGRA